MTARTWSTQSAPRNYIAERTWLTPSQKPARPPEATPRTLWLRLKELRGPHELALQVAHTESGGFRLWLDKAGRLQLSVRFPADQVELLLRVAKSEKPGWLTDEAIVAYACALPGAVAELRTAEILRGNNYWIQEPLTPDHMSTQDKRNIQPRN